MSANQIQHETLKLLFDKFKAEFPNNQEPYNPAPENVNRWQWHLNKKASLPIYAEMERMEPDDYSKKIAERRRVSHFGQMDTYNQVKFCHLANLFPGIQVWATGSRVNGTYIGSLGYDRFYGPILLNYMRRQFSKESEKVSDFDIWIDPKESGITFAEMRERLPSWADLLPHSVPDRDKIPIPMWDFTRLPKKEHPNVLDLYERRQWGKLMQIHNHYHLSPQPLCCNENAVKQWFGWAIRENIITNEIGNESETPSV